MAQSYKQKQDNTLHKQLDRLINFKKIDICGCVLIVLKFVTFIQLIAR